MSKVWSFFCGLGKSSRGGYDSDEEEKSPSKKKAPKTRTGKRKSPDSRNASSGATAQHHKKAPKTRTSKKKSPDSRNASSGATAHHHRTSPHSVRTAEPSSPVGSYSNDQYEHRRQTSSDNFVGPSGPGFAQRVLQTSKHGDRDTEQWRHERVAASFTSAEDQQDERRSEKICDINPLISDIFQTSEEIRRDFISRMLEEGVKIDSHHLREGYVSIHPFDPRSYQKVKNQLVAMFITHYLDESSMSEIKQKVDAESRKHRQKFRYEYSKKQRRWNIVFHTDIVEDMPQLIYHIRFRTIHLAVPCYLVSYFLRVCDSAEQGESAFRGCETVEIENETDGKAFVNMVTERKMFPEVEKQLYNLLEKLVYRDEKIKISADCCLQTTLGEEFIKSQEKQHCCKISVQDGRQRLLLQSWSPCGQQIMVCEGSVMDAATDLVVLPLCDGQVWRQDPRKFLGEVFKMTRPLPNQQKILVCDWKVPRGSQKVVLMSVPSNTDNDFRDHFRQFLRSLFKYAAANSSIALPLKFDTEFTEEPAMFLLNAIVEAMRDNKLEEHSCQLKLFTEQTALPQIAKFCEWMDKLLTQWKWATSGIGKSDPGYNHRVKVVVGKILDEQADVLVNSTDPDLTHDKGQVSQCVLDQAGPGLQKRCHELYPEGLRENIVAVTDAFGVRTFKKIFHIALMQTFWEENLETHVKNALLEDLKVRVQSCLTLASARQFKSIVFPTLSTGTLNYPPDRVAEAMLTAIHDFFREMPHSSLQHVCICCYIKDKELIKKFKAEEILHIYGLRSPLHSAAQTCRKGAWLTIHGAQTGMRTWGEAIVQIIEGDAPAHRHQHTADKIITASFNAEAVRQADHQTAVQNNVRKGFEGVKESSTIMIDLQSFGRDNFQDVLQVAAKKIAKHNLHAVLMVPGEDFEDAIEAAPSEWKEKVNYYSGSNMAEATVPSQTASVQISGRHLHVEKVMGQIRNKLLQNRPVPFAEFTTDGWKDVAVPGKTSQVSAAVATTATVTATWEPQPCPPFQHPTDDTLTREVDSLTVEALQLLIKGDFNQLHISQKKGGRVTIACNGPAAEELMCKIDSLRYEEVHTAQSDFEKIPDPLDTTPEGVVACLIPVPKQGKVVVFSFEYNSLSKAKHLLNVKLGKVKTTSRGQRRFDGNPDRTGNGLGHLSPPLSSRSPQGMTATTNEFKTKTGIKVSVYKTDITKLPVDAIANAANEHLSHGGGVAYAISRSAGFDLEDECQDYLRRHGPLEVMGVVATTAGSLPCKKVLHAVGPRWSDYQDKGVCQQHLTDTVYNCLQKAEAVRAQSVALPSISSAIFGVPKEVCARSYLSAVQKFDKLHGANTCVRHIHFVDVSDDMISVISKTFTHNWDVDLQPPITSGSRRDKGSSRSSAQERQSEPGQQRDTGSSRSSAQERQPEPGQQRGTGSRSSVQERQSEPGQQREKVGTRAEPCAPQYNKTHRNGTGSQPPGSTMRMRYSSKPVAGYEDGGSLCIDYCIPGVQTGRSNSGQQYPHKLSRTAYLPNTQEGRTVLMLLKIAFDRHLVFTVDRSGIIWRDIHHKTARQGGVAENGYPDPDYLRHVQEQLRREGVTEKDLTDTQKNFIYNPEQYIQGSNCDFSDCFATSHGTVV